MSDWMTTLITIVASVGASSGFWAYLTNRNGKKSATTRLLLGLAHDRIIFLGMSYVDRGYVSKDEYEDFLKYLYEPYSEFGGNGLAEKVKSEVDKLPWRGVTKGEIKPPKENDGKH